MFGDLCRVYSSAREISYCPGPTVVLSNLVSLFSPIVKVLVSSPNLFSTLYYPGATLTPLP